jgi:outer membrane protein assembly factor BamB
VKGSLPIALLIPVLCGCSSVPGDDDWPRFRGPNGSGVADSRRLPALLDPGKNLAWKAPVPQGNSSPVVVGGRLFLTGWEGDKRLVLAFEAASGKLLWRKAFSKARPEIGNPMNGPATPTPAAGGGGVVAFFPDIGLVALSAEGDELWQAPLGPFKSLHGISSSPVLVDGKILLVVDQLEGSYLAAFHAASGKPVWRTERASGVTGGYSTPTVLGSGSQALVIVAGALELAAYRASSGERVWWATGLTNAPVGSPVLDGEKVYVCEPVGETYPFSSAAAFDKNGDGKISREEVAASEPGMVRFLDRLDTGFGNGDGLLEASEWDKAFGTFEGNGGLSAVRLGGVGEIQPAQVAWRYKKAVAHVPSVLIYRNTLFEVRDGGILTTFDPATGNILKQARLEGAGGTYYASPVAGDGKVILVSEAGKVSLVKAEPQWELLASSDLGESTFATPAIAGGRVFIRTAKALYSFAR